MNNGHSAHQQCVIPANEKARSKKGWSCEPDPLCPNLEADQPWTTCIRKIEEWATSETERRLCCGELVWKPYPTNDSKVFRCLQYGHFNWGERGLPHARTVSLSMFFLPFFFVVLAIYYFSKRTSPCSSPLCVLCYSLLCPARCPFSLCLSWFFTSIKQWITATLRALRLLLARKGNNTCKKVIMTLNPSIYWLQAQRLRSKIVIE